VSGRLIDPVVHIPPTIQAGDTVTWTDESFTDSQGTPFNATGYGLQYTIVGPLVNGVLAPGGEPVQFTAAAEGMGWLMTLQPSDTAGWFAGAYQWQAQLIATNFALTVARGELAVVANLAGVSAGYCGWSQAETALAQWQTAYAALAPTSGSPVKSYRIGTREFTYRDLKEVESAIAYWNAVVTSERTRSSISQNQGNPRKLYARFPSKYGILS
jgi:hypothetical protein